MAATESPKDQNLFSRLFPPYARQSLRRWFAPRAAIAAPTHALRVGRHQAPSVQESGGRLLRVTFDAVDGGRLSCYAPRGSALMRTRTIASSPVPEHHWPARIRN